MNNVRWQILVLQILHRDAYTCTRVKISHTVAIENIVDKGRVESLQKGIARGCSNHLKEKFIFHRRSSLISPPVRTWVDLIIFL